MNLTACAAGFLRVQAATKEKTTTKVQRIQRFLREQKRFEISPLRSPTMNVGAGRFGRNDKLRGCEAGFLRN